MNMDRNFARSGMETASSGGKGEGMTRLQRQEMKSWSHMLGARQMYTSVTALLFVGSLLCLAAPVEAQTNGVRVGNGRLHPSLDLQVGYDSFAGVGFEGGSEATGDLLLRILPGLSLEVPGPTAIFNLDAKADYNRYLGIDVRGTRALSYLGGNAHLGLVLNPGSRFTLELGDRFSHSDRTSAVGLGVGVLSLFNEVYAAASISPGGGAFILRPVYSFAFEGFLSSRTISPLSDEADRFNYLSHRPGMEISWRFLPKTALVLDVRSDIRRYPDEDFNVSSNALYALLGVSGLITPRIAIVARGGYGNSFVPEDELSGDIENYQSFIGQLDGTYILSQTARFKAGVARTFFPVSRLGWYGDNRVYASGQALFAGRLLTELEGAVHFLNYAQGRQDVLLNPSLKAGYQITPWLNVGLGYRFSLRRSDEDGLDIPAATEYDRHEVFGAVMMKY